MLTGIILNFISFIHYYTPSFTTFQYLMVFFLLLTFISTVSTVFIFYKVIYIFNFIVLILFIFLNFGFNQYIGFFFLIEISTALFILAIVVELKLNYKKYSYSKDALAAYIAFFISYVFTSKHRMAVYCYGNYFDSFASDYYLINLNSLLGVYLLFFDFRNLFVFIMSWSFVLVTYVIILFYKRWKMKKNLQKDFKKNIYKATVSLNNIKMSDNKTNKGSKKTEKNQRMDWFDKKCKFYNHDKAIDLILDYRNYDKYKFR